MRAGRPVGLRAQLIVALAVVFAVAAAVTLAVIEPLTSAASRLARRRYGEVLSRAVAGQVARAPDAEVEQVLAGSVGEGALTAAALVRPDGYTFARAGRFTLRELLSPTREDGVFVTGNILAVRVWLPPRGTFVAEFSLLPGRAERALPTLLLLYSTSAASLGLLVVYLLLTRWMVRPIESLTLAAERVAEGRRDVAAEERGAAEVVRAAAAFNRMTEQLRARESELSSRVEALERTTQELAATQELVTRGERLAVVGRLSAGIAHEVGNPLAAIVGLSEVLAEGGNSDDEIKEFAGRIGQEARRIHRTVRELLDYARAAPTGADPLAAASADVSESVEQVARLLRPQKSFRGFSLDADVERGIARAAIAPDRLVQVLLNLCLNSLDAMRADGRHEGALRVSASSAAGALRIVVDDTGPGIPEALRARVFEPFFTTKPSGEGTGLGLATSASIIEQAGGTLTVGDLPEGSAGARMVIVLPASRDRSSSVTPATPAGSGDGA